MFEKRLLQAAALLVRSLKMINGADMLEIGAASDLRSYLNGQEAVCLLVLEHPELFGHRLCRISSSASCRIISTSNPFGAMRAGQLALLTNKLASRFSALQGF